MSARLKPMRLAERTYAHHPAAPLLRRPGFLSARSCERFYFNRWICAGRADRFRARATTSRGRSATRASSSPADGSGEIHALFNVCRHRGTRLCDAAEGHLTDRIQCPYHNWTYDLEGRLLAAPHMAPGFCKDDYPAAPRRLRDLGGQHLRPPRRRVFASEHPCPTRPTCPARSAGRPARAVRRLADGRPPHGTADRLRRQSELEADRPQLQRVPALPEPAPRAQQAASLPRRRQRRADRLLLRRRDGVSATASRR